MNIKNYLEFILEKNHVNQDVKHITNLIYNKLEYLLPKLIKDNQIITNNIIKDYKKINLIGDDHITFNLKSKPGGEFKYINNDYHFIFDVKLSESEKRNKVLYNNKIKEVINHEVQHFIEIYLSNGNYSKSWNFNTLLDSYNNKYKDYDKWMVITYIFYYLEDHEIRSRVSQFHEVIKNYNKDDDGDLNTFIKNTDLYKKIDDISKMNPDNILVYMRINYLDFDIILDEFVKNVIKINGDSDSIFKNEFNNLISKATKMKKKLNKISYFNISNNLNERYDE